MPVCSQPDISLGHLDGGQMCPRRCSEMAQKVSRGAMLQRDWHLHGEDSSLHNVLPLATQVLTFCVDKWQRLHTTKR